MILVVGLEVVYGNGAGDGFRKKFEDQQGRRTVRDILDGY
jgi:hypothetical protein